MPISLRTTINGPLISPSLGLRKATADAVDEAAAVFADRLLLRVDPRDIKRNAANPSGRRQAHAMAPNRDIAAWAGTGFSVETIPAKYNGKEVFKFNGSGTAAAGNHNDFLVGPKSLNNVTQFTLFGAAHFDASMLGTAGFHTLVGFYRDGSTLESCFAHQFVSTVDYLSIFADQASGGGANHTIVGSAVVAAGTPFAYMWRVLGTSVGDSQNRLYINQTVTQNAGNTGADVPEAGQMQFFLGHLTADNHQWTGGHGRAYIVSGDALDTAANQAASVELMAQIKTLYGIA